MKLRRSLVEGLDRLLRRICEVSAGLGRTNSWPAAAVSGAGQRLVRNPGATVHCYGFFSGADLLCMQAQTELAGDAKGIAVQATDPNK